MKSHLFLVVVLTITTPLPISSQLRKTRNENQHRNRNRLPVAAQKQNRLPVSTQTNNQNETDTHQIDRIVGGDEAIPFRYPYITGLLGRSGNFPMCGGSLIAPNLVLTAAHCIGPTADYIDINKAYVKRVLLGAHDLFASEVNTREVISVKKIIVHERYFDQNYRGYDIALLQLVSSSNKQPVPLVDPNHVLSDLELTVAGWGTLKSGGFTSDKLMDVNVNHMTNNVCNSAQKYNGMITDSMLCAAAHQKDACQGDSGGPLIYNPNNGRDHSNPPDASLDKLVGIVSWGYGCAEARYPGVYANVQMLYDWIKEEGCQLVENGRRDLLDMPDFSAGLDMAMQNNDLAVMKDKFALSQGEDGMTLLLNGIDSNTNNNNRGIDLNNSDNRIVGGTTVDLTGEQKRYPFHVGVFTNSGRKPMCGGSLIASNVVLCAAHCSAYAKKVKIGYWHNGNAADVAQAETFSIMDRVVHPNYRGSDADIVLFKLSGHSTLQSIKLVSDVTYSSLTTVSKLWVIGWGRIKSGGATSDKLQHVDVNYVTNSNCNNKYSGSITSNMICAASPGKDACQGDSGGPLIVKRNTAAEDELVGCVSWGYGCASPNYPGVYCDVHVFRSWVKGVACDTWNVQGRLCGNGSGPQPIPQPISQPVSQPIPQPVSRPISQPTNPNNPVPGLCGAPVTPPPVTAAPIPAPPVPYPTTQPVPAPVPYPTTPPISTPTPPAPPNNDKLEPCTTKAIGCNDADCFIGIMGRKVTCATFYYIPQSIQKTFCDGVGDLYCPDTCSEYITRCQKSDNESGGVDILQGGE